MTAKGARVFPSLRRAGETLLLAGAPQELVAIPKAERGAGGPLLVPERLQALLELLELGDDRRVVRFRELLPELESPLRGALDLLPNVLQRRHISVNEKEAEDIPQRRRMSTR
jgi:hypothetical protein